MAQGFMGATQPRLLVAWLVTFHPFQGLFVWFPLTVLAMAGVWWRLARGDRSERVDAALAIVVFGVLLLYTSAYFMWWGGWAYAPRHLIPALPWLALGLIPFLASRKRRWGWVAVCAIGLIGLVLNVSAVALDPQVSPGLDKEILMQPESVKHWPTPVWMLLRYVWQFGQTDHNWGTALGLRGAWSLFPLALIWLAGWWAIGRESILPHRREKK